MSDAFIFLSHPLFEATVLKQGAQLIQFQPKGEKPFFWHADFSTFQKGKAFRGGIPLCWPWFGKASNPSHGFARLLEWDLASQTTTDESITLVFELHDSAFTKELWSSSFHAMLTMHLGRDVKMEFSVLAGQTSTAALHSYFACSHIEHVCINGLGTSYQDALKNAAVFQSKQEQLRIQHGVDRVYTSPRELISLHDDERVLTITSRKASDAVVWNPWEDGSRNFPDMQKDDYTKMVCIESAKISTPLMRSDSLDLTIQIQDK